MIKHISIFMPTESAFHRRLYGYLTTAFRKHGLQVSGACRLLTEPEMVNWVREKKPCAIFEMNRIKDEIPVLHELGVLHLSWVVDMQGRDESHIKGSDITYTFDPGWVINIKTDGLVAWMPPGTCTKTFFPDKKRKKEIEFSFIGHIPNPWSKQELSRLLVGESKNIVFETLLNEYSDLMDVETYKEKTHESCVQIINDIVSRFLGHPLCLSRDMYYDLLVRIKRMNNRVDLLDFGVNKTDSIAIYGSENWLKWSKYKKYYRNFVGKSFDVNLIHNFSEINLHDGVSFHFRAIDCMASGGLLFWYDDNHGDKYNSYKWKNLFNKDVVPLGLHTAFQSQFHYFEFKYLNFDEVYEEAKIMNYHGSVAQQETLKIIKSHHTWDCRAKKILEDIVTL
jgi:hypothetical protein